MIRAPSTPHPRSRGGRCRPGLVAVSGCTSPQPARQAETSVIRTSSPRAPPPPPPRARPRRGPPRRRRRPRDRRVRAGRRRHAHRRGHARPTAGLRAEHEQHACSSSTRAPTGSSERFRTPGAAAARRPVMGPEDAVGQRRPGQRPDPHRPGAPGAAGPPVRSTTPTTSTSPRTASTPSSWRSAATASTSATRTR